MSFTNTNILSFNKLYKNKWKLNRKNIIVFLILIFPLLFASDIPLISYFLEDYKYLVTIFDNKIIAYDYDGNMKSYTSIYEELNINSPKLAYMSSLGYIYNDDYKIIFVTVNDSNYYGINGTINMKLNNNNITERPSNINPYECKEESGNKYCYFYISLIGSDYKLQIYKYNLIYGQNSYNCINYKIIELSDSSSRISPSGSDFVTCKIMSYSNNQRYACFYENSNSEIGSIILELDTLEQDSLKQLKFKKNSGAKYIQSVLFNNNEKAFICYINNYNNIACIIYDLNRTEFEEEYKYIENIDEGNYFSIDYFKSTDRYILSSYSSETKLYYEIFHDQMYIADTNTNGGKYCLTFTSMSSCSNGGNLPSVVIFYSSNTYKLAKRCQNDQDYIINELSTTCNENYDRERIVINEESPIRTESESQLSELPRIESESLSSELPRTESEYLFSELPSTNQNLFQYGIKKINSNKTLEQEIIQLNNLIKEMNYGEVYEIKGKGYLIKISPINYNQYEETSTYINFLDCEKTLKIKNDLKLDDNLTVVIIEINKNNEKALTQQIEYEVFYNTTELDLSVCNLDEIEIYYDVKNSSLIDLEKVLKYSQLGIDIFNINSSFFNDICYPYSEDNSDMILKDRISNIIYN